MRTSVLPLCFLFLMMVLPSLSLIAQDLEKLKEVDKVKLSGGVSFNSVHYKNISGAQRREPLSWFLQGNINVDLIDWSMPFSFSYSDQDISYAQPFNQYGVQPKYKWAKGLLGYNNMSFSKYTLAGHVFLGVGTELTPGRWDIKAMAGRLMRPSSLGEAGDFGAYKRVGHGLSVAYKTDRKEFGLHYFHGEDVTTKTLLQANDEGNPFIPQENTVLSYKFGMKVKKRLKFEVEQAISGFTRDNREAVSSANVDKDYMLFLFNPNNESYYASAITASGTYDLKKLRTKFMYERVAPDFQSMGTYFINNDLENIAFSPSVTLFKSKLQLNGNVGMQRNNLSKTKSNTTKRAIGSLNMSLMPTKKLATNFSYSNFTSYSLLSTPQTPLSSSLPDTLKFHQITQSAGYGLTYRLVQNAKQTSFIQLNGSFMNSSELSANETAVPSKVWNSILGYHMSFISSKVKMGFTFNTTALNNTYLSDLFFGPGIQLAKTTLKKWKLTLGSVYNVATSSISKGYSVLNNSFSLNRSFKLKESDSSAFNLRLGVYELLSFKEVINHELTGNFSLAYNFN